MVSEMLIYIYIYMVLRSAGAASKLEQAGYQNIACITSGLQSVKPGNLNSILIKKGSHPLHY